jgi:hypothetical protein
MDCLGFVTEGTTESSISALGNIIARVNETHQAVLARVQNN